MKLAIVHDDFIQSGGAERLVVAMSEIWPEAGIFSAIASSCWIDFFLERRRHLLLSGLQKWPFKEKLYRYYFPLYPLVFEAFDFSPYDVVLSSSARFAHGIITKPGTVHLAYINSPARMWWESAEYFLGWGYLRRTLATPLLSFMRQWDLVAAQRPDYLIANSGSTAAKIKKYWRRGVDKIIYPFFEEEKFPATPPPLRGGAYFLVVSRLLPWKRIDLAVKACSQLGFPLVVIGEGPARQALERVSGSSVKFLDYVTEEDKIKYLQGCRALVHPQEEDFGLTPLEAMACGKPVIAYGAGGALETVIEGRTGVFFREPTVESLVAALADFDPSAFSPAACRQQAEQFGRERFVREIKGFVREKMEGHSSGAIL